MERHDDRDARRRPGWGRRAQAPGPPEQGAGDPGFAEGLDHKPDTPEEELESDFARGLRRDRRPRSSTRAASARASRRSPRTRRTRSSGASARASSAARPATEPRSGPGQARDARRPVRLGRLAQGVEPVLARRRPAGTVSADRLLASIAGVDAPLSTTSAHGWSSAAAIATASGGDAQRAGGRGQRRRRRALGQPPVGDGLLDDHAQAGVVRALRAPGRRTARAGSTWPARRRTRRWPRRGRSCRPAAGRSPSGPTATPSSRSAASPSQHGRRRPARRSRASRSGSGRGARWSPSRSRVSASCSVSVARLRSLTSWVSASTRQPAV